MFLWNFRSSSHLHQIIQSQFSTLKTTSRQHGQLSFFFRIIPATFITFLFKYLFQIICDLEPLRGEVPDFAMLPCSSQSLQKLYSNKAGMICGQFINQNLSSSVFLCTQNKDSCPPSFSYFRSNLLYVFVLPP